MLGLNLVYKAMDKGNVIWDKLKDAQSRQKSYIDLKRRDLEFEVRDKVFLKMSPIKGVMKYRKKGKLHPRYIGPYVALIRVPNVGYELEFPSSLSFIHLIFHVSMLRKYICHPSLVVPLERVGILDFLPYEKTRLRSWIKRFVS